MKFPLMNEAGTGAPGGAAPPAGAAPQAGGGAAPSTPWHVGFDADTQGWVVGKGWDKLPVDKALPEIIKGYRGAESYIGVPADQLLRLPKDGDASGMNAVYDRLGRPKDAAGYTTKHPEGTDQKYVDWSRTTFHKIGLNNQQAQALVDAHNEFISGVVKEQDAAYKARTDAEEAALKKEWGPAVQKNEQMAKAAGKMLSEKLGMDGNMVDAIEKAIGYGRTMKLFQGIAAMLGEDRFVASGDAGKFADANGAGEARAKLSALKKDADFVKRLNAGDVQAKAEWDKLHQQAAAV